MIGTNNNDNLIWTYEVFIRVSQSIFRIEGIFYYIIEFIVIYADPNPIFMKKYLQICDHNNWYDVSIIYSIFFCEMSLL